MWLTSLGNRRAVHRTLLFVLAAVWLLVAAGLFSALPHFWSDHPFLSASVTLVLLLTFSPLRSLLSKQVDRFFFGGWYDYRSVVAEMSQALAGIVETDELADLLVERLPEVLHLRAAAMILPTAEGDLRLFRSSNLQRTETEPPALPLGGSLVGELLRAARPITRADILESLEAAPTDESEKWWLSRSDFKLWVPFVRRGAKGASLFARLNGILLLSGRARGDFEAEDRRMLGTLAWGAAVAAENVELISALRRRAEEVNQLYSQLIDSREEERKRLSRELHDRVIQDLIDLHYASDFEARNLSPSARSQLEPLRHGLRGIIDSIRQVCSELRPSALDDLSLELAIQGYVEDVKRKHGLKVSLKLPEDSALAKLPEEAQIGLFRVLQEALNNVHRHADATEVAVELNNKADEVTLEVRDNGRGFSCPANLGALIRKGCYGLAGAQERMNLLGGRLRIVSKPDQGTRIAAAVMFYSSASSGASTQP